MFQDDAGTTPVTAVEQTVGRVLDLSGNANHATQSVAASRPTYRARYNLLEYSEQFNNLYWTKTNAAAIAANSTTAPDGTISADTLSTPTTGASRTVANTSAPIVANVNYTFSVYAKRATSDWIFLVTYDVGVGAFAWFNVNTGTTGTTSAGVTASIQSVGDGWFRCSFVRTMTSPVAFAEIRIGLANADNSISATAGNSVFIWGAQLVPTNVFASNTYQRIASSTDYATGASFPPYLAFDGSDDSMLTNAIDFTGTDKMTVWAGVTKLSDSAQRVVAELSASIASNNGAFLLSAPNSAAANYNWSSKGTTQVDNTVTTFAAPRTNVLTGQADIAAPSNIIRVNGAQAGSVATTQGTGNFGNYPLYIGRRNNATLPFSGRLYGLIVRGAASSPTQIADTESWMNGKTGAY